MDETKENVLGADVVVVEEPCFFLGKNDDPSGPICESLKHVVTSSNDQWRLWRLTKYTGQGGPTSAGRLDLTIRRLGRRLP
jgi:hypothetical protein